MQFSFWEMKRIFYFDWEMKTGNRLEINEFFSVRKWFLRMGNEKTSFFQMRNYPCLLGNAASNLGFQLSCKNQKMSKRSRLSLCSRTISSRRKKNNWIWIIVLSVTAVDCISHFAENPANKSIFPTSIHQIVWTIKISEIQEKPRKELRLTPNLYSGIPYRVQLYRVTFQPSLVPLSFTQM